MGSPHLQTDHPPCAACCWHLHTLRSSRGATTWASPAKDIYAVGILRPLLDPDWKPRPTRVSCIIHTSSGANLQWEGWLTSNDLNSIFIATKVTRACLYAAHSIHACDSSHTVQLISVLVHGLKISRSLSKAGLQVDAVTNEQRKPCYHHFGGKLRLSWHDIHCWKQNGIAVSASLKLCQLRQCAQGAESTHQWPDVLPWWDVHMTKDVGWVPCTN